MIGKKILHYEILSKLGEGGMGIVYKAADTKLDRTVAIKFLPHHIAANAEERQRFEIEAKAAAALQHQNIATIFAIENEDDELFMVMEYIEGKELRELIAAGKLALSQVLHYGVQIAKGLHAAHQKGIVHRDIKSANIMVSHDNQVKIMDFGLAKVAGNVVQLTKEHTTIGTASYMSPEQTRGEVVDHRADIWAFGVLLYEMLTGELPFKGEYEQAVFYCILNDDYSPVGSLRSDAPKDLTGIVDRALRKQADERYADADEMSTALAAIQTRRQSPHEDPPGRPKMRVQPWILLAVLAVAVVIFSLFLLSARDGTGTIDSIAVLPLENLSRQADQEYFSDGMTDALIHNLGKLGALKVISRTSVMRYKNSDKSLLEIANDLGVSHIIEGSVLRTGDQVRITANLIDASDDRQIWGQSYERELTDIIALQNDVSREIASQVQITMSPQEEARFTDAKPVNPQAYDAYLKGRFHWNKRTPEGLETGVDYFQEAIRFDPDYALAHAGLADSYYFLLIYGTRSASEMAPLAQEAATRALELDPTLAEAHTSLAQVTLSFDHDYAAAEAGFQRAITLNPGYATAHHWFGILLANNGRFEEGIAEIQAAKALDPLSLIINVNEAFPILAFAGEHDLAIRRLRETIDLDPGFWLAHHWLGVMLAVTGDYATAHESLSKAREISNDLALPQGMVAFTYALAGEATEAEAILNQLQQQSGSENVSTYEIALVYGAMGELDRAFDYLETAYEQRDGWLQFIYKDPRGANLRKDQRYLDLIQRIGFE